MINFEGNSSEFMESSQALNLAVFGRESGYPFAIGRRAQILT